MFKHWERLECVTSTMYRAILDRLINVGDELRRVKYLKTAAPSLWPMTDSEVGRPYSHLYAV
jgi:hypothetical protein